MVSQQVGALSTRAKTLPLPCVHRLFGGQNWRGILRAPCVSRVQDSLPGASTETILGTPDLLGKGVLESRPPRKWCRQQPLSTPVRTSPRLALHSASSWAGDSTLAESGVLMSDDLELLD